MRIASHTGIMMKPNPIRPIDLTIKFIKSSNHFEKGILVVQLIIQLITNT